MHRRNFLILAAAVPVIGTLTRPAMARAPQVFEKKGLAIRGTDPVAYFTQGAPVAGDPGITAKHNGATWAFASTAHRDMFQADPERYAPQFGGYCSYAVSRGYIADTIPEAWAIYQDRLYLNYNLNVREIWKQDIPGNVAKANANWPKVLEA